MSRFKLFENLEIEAEVKSEEGMDELPSEEEVEDKVESETEDTLYDLAVNFILALPEDSIPEDLKSVYDALIDKIGDEYLGDDEEGSEDELEGSEGESEEEMKESVQPKEISFKLKKDTEWDEWVVQVFVNGKYDENKSYRTSAESDKDKETKKEAKLDAESTMQDMINRYKKNKKFIVKES